jgi:hypothetical protein
LKVGPGFEEHASLRYATSTSASIDPRTSINAERIAAMATALQGLKGIRLFGARTFPATKD